MSKIEYEDIVSNLNSPTLVLAGPGAGKTYLLGDRVKRLLDSGVSESQITLLAFSKDATQNMRNKLLDPDEGFGIPYKKLPRISTINSLGFEIVKKRPRSVGLRKLGLEVQEDKNVKRLLFRDASLILGFSEENGEKARECKQRGDCKIGSRETECSICKKYWEIMSKCNRIDFDDQVLFAINILEDNPDLLQEYQENSRHLLVDEYQDINVAQFRLIELLSRNSRNGLFVVGDDAQSIYGFRGASPEFILRFNEDFPHAFTPPLAHSRRCHEKTMFMAVKILEEYYPSWTNSTEIEYHVPSGDAPRIWGCRSEISEAQWVARIARAAVAKGKSVLVLAPKKDFFPLVIKTLHKYGVPCIRPMNLLTREANKRLKVIERILGWVRNQGDSFLTRVALEILIDHGIAKVPGADKGRRCTPETINQRIIAETEIAKLWDFVDKKNDLRAVLSTLQSPSDTLRISREALEQLATSFANSKYDIRVEFVKQLSIASGVWVDPIRLVEDLGSVIDLINAEQPTGFGAVQLMTMRKAKGLQADIVIMIGLEDDIIPDARSDSDEQARLFYVSMTRTKEQVYLLHSLRRPCYISFGNRVLDKKRSRFLDALGEDSIFPTGITETA